MSSEPTGAKSVLASADPILSKIIVAIPAPKIESTHDVFFDLMSCVLEQQIHYRSTKKTFQKMLDRAELATLTPDNFGDFEAKAFSSVQLSGSKYETILSILKFWNTRPTHWQSLNDEAVRAQLSSIKGIGTWTMDMILLYTLQRPCVFPSDDFHLKQIMVSLYGLDPNARLKAQMLDVASAWGEHQSLAVLYLLAWKAHNKKSGGSGPLGA